MHKARLLTMGSMLHKGSLELTHPAQPKLYVSNSEGFFFYKVSLLENIICIKNKHTRSKTLSIIFEFSLFLILLSKACLVLFLNLPQNITSSGLLMLVFQLKSSLGVLWQTASTLTSLPMEHSCQVHTLHWASFL